MEYKNEKKVILVCLILFLTVIIIGGVSAGNFYQQRMEIREATFIEKISNFFGGGFNIYIGDQGAPSDLYVSIGETVTVRFVMSDFGDPADVSSYNVHTPAGNYDLTSNLKSLHDISVTYSFTPSTAGEFTIWESLVLYSKGTNPFIYNQVNVHVTSQAKTCSEKNGQICPSSYNCYGTIVTASDTSQCCVPDVNTGQKCVRVIDAECDSGTTKCVGQNHYECVSGLWKDKGLIIGQCGVTGGTCTPNWQTGNWSDCTNGVQTRTVTDLNNCGTTTNKPATNQSCTQIQPATCSGIHRTCRTSLGGFLGIEACPRDDEFPLGKLDCGILDNMCCEKEDCGKSLGSGLNRCNDGTCQTTCPPNPCISEQKIFYSDGSAIFNQKTWVIIPITSTTIKENNIISNSIDEIIPSFSLKYFENPSEACCENLTYEYTDSSTAEYSTWSIIGEGNSAKVSYSIYKCIPKSEAGFCLDFAHKLLNPYTHTSCQNNSIILIVLVVFMLIIISRFMG